jgi:hypothetical protein
MCVYVGLQDLTQKRKVRGRLESVVLEPCRLGLTFKLQGPAPGQQDGAGLTDISLDVSDIRLSLSPDVVQMATSLAGSALQPLLQPKPDAPLTTCNQFERLWTFDPAELLQQQNKLAIKLVPTGAEGGELQVVEGGHACLQQGGMGETRRFHFDCSL